MSQQLHLTTLTIALLCILPSYADILVFPVNGRYIETEAVDFPANFGLDIPYEGVRGMLVSADPPDACRPVKPPPTYINFTGKWLLLVARYNCTFEEKVRIAQNASYDGIIVYNVNSDKLEPMRVANSTGIRIYAVFIGASKGEEFRQYYANEDYFVLINNEIPFNIQTHLILPFAIVVGICFIVMVIFMIIKCIKDRRRQRRHRLPASTLNKIPICKFQKGDPYETCAICLDDYIEGEKLRVLPCNHVYHTKCIDPWLTKNRRVCPICKRKVFAQDEVPYADSDSDSDSDDTSPLVNRSGPLTEGGTFQPQRENPFQRAARSISQQSQATNFVTASDHHSINAEPDSDDTDSSSCGSTECLVRSSGQSCEVEREVHVHTTPGTSSVANSPVV